MIGVYIVVTVVVSIICLIGIVVAIRSNNMGLILGLVIVAIIGCSIVNRVFTRILENSSEEYGDKEDQDVLDYSVESGVIKIDLKDIDAKKLIDDDIEYRVEDGEVVIDSDGIDINKLAEYKKESDIN